MSTETITDPVGRRTYSPSEEACRKAPALLCQVAARVVKLREELTKLDRPHYTRAEVERLLKPFCETLPFENDLLSGSIERVDHAITNS